jgi:glycosyltransferase involved in cell wall biosynthesis
VHNNISLRAAWPLAVVGRPWVVVHQTFLRRPDGSLGLADRVKRGLLRRARSIAISNAVARDLPLPATIVPNPYRDDLFRITNPGSRPYELAYLGRLVSDKGAALLLEAMARLRAETFMPRLLLIGSGPEEGRLRAQTERLRLCDQVVFAGPQSGHKLVELLNKARILVVPSLWPEPFGIVAIEAIACGCAVIGSEGGGLPEAIGPCGITFPNGDAGALARRMAEILRDEQRLQAFAAAAPAHLARHTAGAVADAWLGVLTAATARRPRRS